MKTMCEWRVPRIAVRWFVVFGLCGLSHDAGAVTIIDTTPFWDSVSNDGDNVSGFGEPTSCTEGQTFTVLGSDTNLVYFTFWMNDRLVHPNPGPVNFAAYIMEWATDRAAGPILYQSEMRTTTNNGGVDGMEQFIFATGGLHLNAGQEYVAFLSATNFLDGVQDDAKFGAITKTRDSVYDGGAFVSIANGGDVSAWTSLAWTDGYGGYSIDAAFRATFVPEPSALFLAGIAGFVLFFVASRVRR